MGDRSPESPRRRKEGMPEWRIKLAAATEGTTAHLWLLLLLVVDITIISMEFLLRGTACGGPAGEQSPKQQNVGDWLHVFSVGILVVFAVHLFLQMVALQAEFFKTAHFLLDTLIIGSALVFELADFRQGDLITVLLLSRVVRVAHSVAHTIKMQQSNQGDALDPTAGDVQNPVAGEGASSDINAFAAETELAVKRITDGDEEFTAGQPVPTDLAAIDDVTKLRLLVAEERKLRERIQGR